jgi:hypothetical protein
LSFKQGVITISKKMAKQITLEEAIVQFGPLVSTRVEIEDAIREAVTRIYEMGRYPGTIRELSFSDGDFVNEDDLMFLYLDDSLYDGMIGFRNKNRGWSIMDQSILYLNKLNGGDMSLIDMGQVEITVDSQLVLRRKYRMPLGFTISGGPYYALMKLEAPALLHNTIIPIHSIGALKAAIIAISYEYVNDDERAQFNWSKFTQLMQLSERQVEGSKKYHIGMDSSLRRRPTQFM